LADADWRSVRAIAEDASLGTGDIWAPDGSRFAITLLGNASDEAAVAVYDVYWETLTPLVTAGELTAMERSLAQGLAASSADPILQSDEQFTHLWPVGWSVDGSSLLIWAQVTSASAGSDAPAILLEVPFGDVPMHVLARGRALTLDSSSLPSADFVRLALAASTGDDESWALGTSLAGIAGGNNPLETSSSSVSWSADGLWAAYVGDYGVTITDRWGNVHHVLREGHVCSDVAWNPTADLTALSRSADVALVSATVDWAFENVRVYHDPFVQRVFAWGELVNKTGKDVRILAFVPALQDGTDNVNVVQWDIRRNQRELIVSVDLAAGASLPFEMAFDVPLNTRLSDGAKIIVTVVAGPGVPTGEELRIASHDYDLSRRPESLRVSGEYEYPDPGYEEYIAIIVTAFGVDGHMMGWDWQQIADPADLSTGRHPFDVTIDFSSPIIDQRVPIGYYKIQAFGR
jgi:hypothetical protein